MNLTNRHIYLFSIVLYLLLQLFFLDRVTNIWIDEPWYANTSFNFSQGKGLVDTAVGSAGGGIFNFLYPLGLGIFFKAFGTSLVTARLFSVLVGLIALLGIIQILRSLRLDNKFVFFGSLIYTFCSVNYIVFRTARPEALEVGLIIWGLYFLILGFIKSQNQSYFWSGLIASASFLCHPNATIYIFLFFATVLSISVSQSKFSFISYFLLGGSITLLAFILYIAFFFQESIPAFIERVMYRSAGGSESFFESVWENLSQFVQLYTLGIKRILVFLVELGVLIWGLFYFRKDKVLFIVSSIGLSSFLMGILFLRPFSTRGFVAILIFSLIALSLIISKIQFSKQDKLSMALLVIFGLYFLNNFTGNLYLIHRDYKNTSYSYVDSEIDRIVPDRTKVVTLLNFWFPLKNNTIYHSYKRWHTTSYNDFDDLLNSGDVEYAVISDYLSKNGTATSGRDEEPGVYKAKKEYYDKVRNFAELNGERIKTIKTNNYGNIEVWKMNNKTKPVSLIE